MCMIEEYKELSTAQLNNITRIIKKKGFTRQVYPKWKAMEIHSMFFIP